MARTKAKGDKKKGRGKDGKGEKEEEDKKKKKKEKGSVRSPGHPSTRQPPSSPADDCAVCRPHQVAGGSDDPAQGCLAAAVQSGGGLPLQGCPAEQGLRGAAYCLQPPPKEARSEPVQSARVDKMKRMLRAATIRVPPNVFIKNREEAALYRAYVARGCRSSAGAACTAASLTSPARTLARLPRRLLALLEKEGLSASSSSSEVGTPGPPWLPPLPPRPPPPPPQQRKATPGGRPARSG